MGIEVILEDMLAHDSREYMIVDSAEEDNLVHLDIV